MKSDFIDGYKKLMKKLTALLLVAVMALSSAGESLAFEEKSENSMDTGNLEIMASESADSFGMMLADVLIESQNGEESNSGSYIADLAMEGETARVLLNTAVEADIVVAVYTEDGQQMLGSGTVFVDGTVSDVTVDIDIAAMPQYFSARAFVLDHDNHQRPEFYGK